MAAINLIWLIPALPLLGAAILGLFGRALTNSGMRLQGAWLATVFCGLSLLLSIWMAIDAGGHEAGQTMVLYSWIPSGDFHVDMGFYLDPLTGVMLLVVTGVATLVHIYSIGYMWDDARDPSVVAHGAHGTGDDLHGSVNDAHAAHADPHAPVTSGGPADASHGTVHPAEAHPAAHAAQHGETADASQSATPGGAVVELLKDGGFVRFFAYLNLFVFSMLMLVLAGNYLIMFVGWELVGLSSYLLIGFWYQKKSATDASKKAFIVNRIGDFGFTLGIIMLFINFGSLAFGDIFPKAASQPFILGNLTITCLLLFMGAMGKSAQFPLHVWLPDAMEGPTPVSALIHAATMVTAGVYLVSRSNPLFHAAPVASFVVLCIGTFTALLGATIALTNNDIKRVVAYSTVSQLGYMFAAAGVGAYAAAIFHLFTHAFFKGLLFLSSGSVIHGMHFLEGQGKDAQDIRNMGGLFKYMPITSFTFIIGALANAGIIPFAGFWSKDAIIGAQITMGPEGAQWFGYITGVLLWGGSFLTAFYMFRVVFLVFFNKPKWVAGPGEHDGPHESPRVMTVPLMILAGAAVLVGGILGFPPDAGIFQKYLEPTFSFLPTETVPDFISVTFPLMLISTIVAVLGIFVAYRLYYPVKGIATRLAEQYKGLYNALLNRWYIDDFYNRVFVDGGKAFCNALWAFDRNVIDGAVNGVAGFFGWGGRNLRRIQTGFVANYAMAITIGVLGLLTYLVFTLLY